MAAGDNATSSRAGLRRVVSGGQTGVDRAALDCAITHGIPHGGWCPAGRLAEDGVIPDRYRLSETRTTDYHLRTQLNVRDTDGTLILAEQPLEGGTALTARIAGQLHKPCLVVDPADNSALQTVLDWLEKNAIKNLNIAGPRSSKHAHIYKHACRFLDRLFAALFR